MEEKLKRAALRLQEVELLLSQPEVYADPARLRDLTREQKELEPVVIAFRELEAARIMQREAEGMLADPELRDLAREELLEARERQNRLTQELKLLLLPKDPDDGRSCGPGSVARRGPCLPQTFFVCTCFMPIAAAGRLMWSTAATRS